MTSLLQSVQALFTARSKCCPCGYRGRSLLMTKCCHEQLPSLWEQRMVLSDAYLTNTVQHSVCITPEAHSCPAPFSQHGIA